METHLIVMKGITTGEVVRLVKSELPRDKEWHSISNDAIVGATSASRGWHTGQILGDESEAFIVEGRRDGQVAVMHFSKISWLRFWLLHLKKQEP